MFIIGRPKKIDTVNTKENKYKSNKKDKIVPTTKLVVMEKCKKCINKCKVESLPHAILIRCPYFKEKKE